MYIVYKYLNIQKVLFYLFNFFNIFFFNIFIVILFFHWLFILKNDSGRIRTYASGGEVISSHTP